MLSLRKELSDVATFLPYKKKVSRSLRTDYMTATSDFYGITIEAVNYRYTKVRRDYDCLLRMITMHPCFAASTKRDRDIVCALLEENGRLDNQQVLNLRDKKATAVLNVVQNWLDTQSNNALRRIGIRLLVKLATASQKWPTSLLIAGIRTNELRDPIKMGGFADVFLGHHKGKRVAIKRLRITSESDRTLLYSKLCKEALVWRQLQHPNIVPFRGVDQRTFQRTHHICIVSEWMDKGSLRDLLKEDTDVIQQHRNKWLHDICSGLDYLHSLKVVHGDLNDVCRTAFFSHMHQCDNKIAIGKRAGRFSLPCSSRGFWARRRR